MPITGGGMNTSLTPINVEPMWPERPRQARLRRKISVLFALIPVPPDPAHMGVDVGA